MSSPDRSRSRTPRGGNDKHDRPPNSRLFVICSKNQKEADLKEYFSQYGEVEDVWLVKDKATWEPKGVAYVKFAKFSQAALAMEESDGKLVMNMAKPIKVIIANARHSHSSRDIDDQTELTRLFVVVPQSFIDTDLYKSFEDYGPIDHVTIIKDKGTGANKGFGYVKYKKVSSAALALENSDKNFKAVLAEPRKVDKRSLDDKFERDHGRMESSRRGYSRSELDRMDYGRSDYGRSDYGLPSRGPPEPRRAPSEPGYDIDSMFLPAAAVPLNLSPRLVADVVGPVTENQIRALFDIIPGMEYCDYREEQVSWGYKGTAYVRYSAASQAAYAKQKLDNFEFPPGCPMQVRFMDDPNQGRQPGGNSVLGGGYPAPAPVASNNPAPQCSVPLPPHQPYAEPESEVEERLFVVCTHPIPEFILSDVFRRFGNLINYRNVHGRNYGYARYAKKESAAECMKALHGQEIAGERIKVIVADPEPDSRKRPRTN